MAFLEYFKRHGEDCSEAKILLNKKGKPISIKEVKNAKISVIKKVYKDHKNLLLPIYYEENNGWYEALRDLGLSETIESDEFEEIVCYFDANFEDFKENGNIFEICEELVDFFCKNFNNESSGKLLLQKIKDKKFVVAELGETKIISSISNCFLHKDKPLIDGIQLCMIKENFPIKAYSMKPSEEDVFKRFGIIQKMEKNEILEKMIPLYDYWKKKLKETKEIFEDDWMKEGLWEKLMSESFIFIDSTVGLVLPSEAFLEDPYDIKEKYPELHQIPEKLKAEYSYMFKSFGAKPFLITKKEINEKKETDDEENEGEIVNLFKEFVQKKYESTDFGSMSLKTFFGLGTSSGNYRGVRDAILWIKQAKVQLETVKVLYQNGIYDQCVFHCQQLTEQSLKAVCICEKNFNGEDERRHSLIIHKCPKEIKDSVGDLVRKLIKGDLYIRTRYLYSGSLELPSEKYKKEEARVYCCCSKTIFEECKKYIIKKLDE